MTTSIAETPSRAKTPVMKRSTRRRLFGGFRYAVLSLWLLVVAFPIFWMVVNGVQAGSASGSPMPPVYMVEVPNTRTTFSTVWTSRSASYSETQEADSRMQRPWVALAQQPGDRGNIWRRHIVRRFWRSFLAYGVSRYRILSEDAHVPAC